MPFDSLYLLYLLFIYLFFHRYNFLAGAQLGANEVKGTFKEEELPEHSHHICNACTWENWDWCYLLSHQVKSNPEQRSQAGF